jgi:DNA-binding transcriptional regulator LsrR (DeoR family)
MYTVLMDTKYKLTPQVLKQAQADLKRMMEERRKIIISQSQEWTQREIAKYWEIDIALVNRIINKGKDNGK